MDKNRPVFVELSIEFIVELLLFLYPYGAEQMNLPHNFYLGLGCWVGATAIAIRMFCIFPVWIPNRTRLEKSLIVMILVTLFVMGVYKPVLTAFRNRNGEMTSSGHPNPTAKSDNPAPTTQVAPSVPIAAMPQRKSVSPTTTAHRPHSRKQKPAIVEHVSPDNSAPPTTPTQTTQPVNPSVTAQSDDCPANPAIGIHLSNSVDASIHDNYVVMKSPCAKGISVERTNDLNIEKNKVIVAPNGAENQ